VGFDELVEKLAEQQGAPLFGAPLLCLDPGRTTGWALFNKDALVEWGELATKDMEAAVPLIRSLLELHDPHHVVVEEYRVYKWKADSHAWAELFTSQLIGFIEGYCVMESIPLSRQSAHNAKSFATDKNLEEWGFWKEGMRHARDAIRHGCYFLIQGRKKWQTINQ
jgi:hypothetical protein